MTATASGRPRSDARPPSDGRRRADPRVIRRRRLTAAVGAILLVGAGIAGVVAAVSGGADDHLVAVFPTPGSRVAPPQTQIVFRGMPVSRLGTVVVRGSRTGVHRGRLLADSDGRGGSFVPNRPFSPGERVTVRLRARLLGRRRGFSFTVATPAGPVPNVPLAAAYRAPNDVLTFHSRPDLEPAAVEVTKRTAQAAPSDIFLTPQHGPVQSGPMILDPTGELVWFHPLPQGTVAADLQVQSYRGRSVLTWWQGYEGAGVGVGEDIVYDSSYRQLAVVHAADGLSADLHEFLLEPGGRALITAYYPVYWDASPVKGSAQAIVLDSVVQEIDVRTGLLLFQWDSLDHVPLTSSYEPLPGSSGQPYDYFHVNSIQPQPDGDLVISARNTWAAYRIDRRTGRIMWTLGGKRSTFKLPPQARFAFQHHVRVHRANDHVLVTVFDDGAGPPTVHDQSRALTLRLDRKHKTVSLVKVDYHSPSLLTSFEGDEQELPGGDEFVGWGQQPYFTEFNARGDVVFDGRFVGGNSSYRAYRFPWRGTPATVPAVAGVTTGTTTTVYASWNGATDVARWQVLTGNAPSSLRVAATQPKRGFETAIPVPAAGYVAVRALDAHGDVLSTSPIRRAQ